MLKNLLQDVNLFLTAHLRQYVLHDRLILNYDFLKILRS